jgi:hypothetical protein
MGYKTTAEMIEKIKEYAGCFEGQIPKQFTVHADYLTDGLSEADFNCAYEKYRRKMREMQSDMAAHPQDCGLIAYDKKGNEKPAYSMNNQYIWLFLALAQAGEVKDNVLHIDGAKFNEFKAGKAVGKNIATPKNIDKLIERLTSHEFIISGDINGDFTITSSIDNLMFVIKASTFTKYARVSMTSDYPAFNYRMYEFGIDEKLPFESTHTYSIMTEKQKEFSSALLKGLYDTGWKSYIFFPHSRYGGRLIFPTVEYYYRVDGGHILIRNEKQTLKLKSYMESLPEKYGVLWEQATRCRGGRKGECKGRILGESFFGKKTALCQSSKAVYGCDMADIPYIIDAAMITAGKK